MANGKIQAIESELDKLTVQHFKLCKTFNIEQLKKVIADLKLTSTEKNLDKAQAKIEQKNKKLKVEREAKAKLEAELATTKILATEAAKFTEVLAEAKKLLAEGPIQSMKDMKANAVEECKKST